MTLDEKKQKTLARQRAWYAANRTKVIARTRAWKDANQEKLAAYYEKNRDDLCAKSRAYHEANRGKMLDRMRDYRKANREKESARNRAWREANPEKVAAWRRDNPEKVAAWSRTYYKKNRETILRNMSVRNSSLVESLKNSYVAVLLGLPVNSVPPHLIEAKREQLLTYRCIKQLEATIKEKQNER